MSKFHFDTKAAKMQAQKRVVLETMANNAINFFKVQVFDAQGFIDKTTVPWAPRKGGKRNQGRKLLVDTGRLRQSITVLGRGPDSIKVGTNVPYAEYHNQGTKTLPKRQFIGKSERLDEMNRKVINTMLKNIL